MHVWSDKGIVLSAHGYANKYRIIDIFTRAHGRCLGLAGISKYVRFSVFSIVVVDHSSSNEISLGFWRLQSEAKSWIHIMDSITHILVCQGICSLLMKVIPLAVPHEGLFDLVYDIARNLRSFSNQEALSAYAYFEFLLLTGTGFGINPQTRNSERLGELWSRGIGSCISAADIAVSLEVTGEEIKTHIPEYHNPLRDEISKFL
ncbi:MAG: recombination protein O N-terminal domain-containing protein [Holosporales bacterium]|jgi:recombinational DNA repair protein (RecF pathway)|nr:recombination protein O N-terminal domain-containing protein [Holosporales bacterium]